MAEKPCAKFEKHGKCGYGDRCRFKHGDTVMCMADDTDDTVMCMEEPAVKGYTAYDTDGTDYDSDEGKPWRRGEHEIY
jgi:hypothetical protein